ncbi:MAG: hypothetical protein EPGJADBJ_05126 [Saprospiraceae bacterium]|nr:hypothetical protein [Saprospiraceae bacterium]
MSSAHAPAREQRILYEIIVDCYDEEEEMIGWYYYFADNLKFPIEATVRLPLHGGKMEEKKVQIVELDTRSETGKAIRLGVVERGSERVHYISPGDIARLETSPENLEIINDWIYWHDFDLVSS